MTKITQKTPHSNSRYRQGLWPCLPDHIFYPKINRNAISLHSNSRIDKLGYLTITISAVGYSLRVTTNSPPHITFGSHHTHRVLKSSRRIQDTLNVYSKILHPDAWMQWVRNIADPFGEFVNRHGMLRYMNSATIKYNKFVGMSGRLKYSIKTVQDGIVVILTKTRNTKVGTSKDDMPLYRQRYYKYVNQRNGATIIQNYCDGRSALYIAYFVCNNIYHILLYYHK